MQLGNLPTGLPKKLTVSPFITLKTFAFIPIRLRKEASRFVTWIIV